MLDARDMTRWKAGDIASQAITTPVYKIIEKKTLRCVAGCGMERNIESLRAAEITRDPVPQFVPKG
jgi:hypothetical protein